MARELLFSVSAKDFTVQTFCAGGPGGQHQNKTASGVRIIHKESGAVGESREHKSQHANKKAAFSRLVETPKWEIWHSRKVLEILSGKTIEQRVEEQMIPLNLKIEGKDQDGRWVTGCAAVCAIRVDPLVMRFLIYGVVRGAIANQNRLARQCEVGEVPIASELGDAAFLWPKAHESASALDRGHV